MTVSYVLAPSPTLQLTDNAGNWVPYGRVRTLDWNTRQPKPTYFDPAGLKARPNPFDLDSVGRAFTVYWEDDSAYFLELQDKNGHPIWRSSEPFIPTGGGGGNVTTNIELTNLFVNGQMRFFPIGKYAPIPNGTTLVADGGWNFVKTGANLADSLEFVRFTPDTTDVDASPTYFLNYISLGAGTGETQKDFVFRFQDVRTLSDEELSVSLSLRSNLLGTYPVEVFATQYFGTGGAPSADVVTTLGTFTPTLVAQQFTATVTLPNLIGKTIGTNGDDGLFITFRMPLNLDANLAMTDFYFKRGASSSIYPYQSYEEVDATLKALALPNPNPTTYFTNPALSNFVNEQAYDVITLVPKDRVLVQEWLPAIPTGSLSLWPSDIIPDGYVAAAGQVLIRPGQYNRLFNVPFSTGTFGTAYGPVTDTIVSSYPWSSIPAHFWLLNSFPGQPLAPWSAGNTGFTFTQSSIGFTPAYVGLSGVGPGVYDVSNLVNGIAGVATTSGLILTVISPGSPSTPFVWRLTGVAPSLISPSTVLEYDTNQPGLPHPYIYFIKDGIGTDPMIPGRVGRACNLDSSMTAAEVGAVVAYAIGQYESGYFSALPASALQPGQFFSVSTPGVTYQIYIQIDGSVTLPVTITGQLVPLSLLSTDTAAEVAEKAADVFKPLLFKMPDWRGYFPRFTDNGRGVDPDANTRGNRGDGTMGDNVGTYEDDATKSPSGTDFWVNQLGGYVQATPSPSVFAFDNVPGAAETRPINIYFTAIVKY